MADAATELQVRSELAEDVIGTYIGRLSAELARAERSQAQSASAHQLAIILWLREELRNAGRDRAKLSEHQADPMGLEAFTELYDQKLFALRQAEQRVKAQSAVDDRTFLRAVLDAPARTETA